MTGEERLRDRPRFGIYPVPWFITVKTVAGDWEWRAITAERFDEAIRERLCWVCGQDLDPPRYSYVFAVGPMCTVTRISAEPPQHLECARYSVTICPFLSDPDRKRRKLDELAPDAAMITRNPGVTALYRTYGYQLTRSSDGRMLVEMATPLDVEWYREGRAATREEVCESFDSGLGLLREIAAKEGLDSQALLSRRVAEARFFIR